MKPVVEINQLGKKYKIKKTDRYLALRDTIAYSLKNIFKRTSSDKIDFWALRDINLKIEAGERLGIIGKNGTLLKLLSRVTYPTTGEALIRGRLASLLEVGTGFHPELTGRENIYLNGSILGLKKTEIKRQFDAIVDFSGVELFLDTALKNYSSGMQLRLAFAVAAHLEPEILLIDEVLAVGDMEFQKKCLGKMEEVSKQQGRTILFVSHNMTYISSLCTKGLLLNNGKIAASGGVSEVISTYVSDIANRTARQSWKENEYPGNDIVKLHSVRLLNSSMNTIENFKVTEDIGIEMVYEAMKDNEVLWLGHNIHNEQGINVFDTHSVGTDYYRQPHNKGMYSSVVWIPRDLLNPGIFFISSAIFNHLKNTIHLHERDILMFTVHEVFDQETARGMSGGDFPGVVRPLLKWQIKKI